LFRPVGPVGLELDHLLVVRRGAVRTSWPAKNTCSTVGCSRMVLACPTPSRKRPTNQPGTCTTGLRLPASVVSELVGVAAGSLILWMGVVGAWGVSAGLLDRWLRRMVALGADSVMTGGGGGGAVAGIIPRWEWRVFGTGFGVAEAAFAALIPGSIGESDEVYLLSAAGSNVKVRDGLMDIKFLREVDGDGLERWEPVMKLDTLRGGVPGVSTLTTAELRLLPLLATHLNFLEIGQRLYLSKHTAKSHAASIYRKLGVSSRSQAVQRLQEIGLHEE
jgi:DNA-binding CsgD family transcriptional regulator